MVKLTVNYDKCYGTKCIECADACPMEVLLINGDKIAIQNTEECSLCEVCMDICPNEAVEVEEN